MEIQDKVYQHFKNICDDNGIVKIQLVGIASDLNLNLCQVRYAMSNLRRLGQVIQINPATRWSDGVFQVVKNNVTVKSITSEAIPVTNEDNDIRRLAEFAVQTIIAMADIVTEKDRQIQELSEVCKETNDKFIKIMEVLTNGKTQSIGSTI